MPDSPMTEYEFTEGLEQALQGRLVTDLGASDELDAAFHAITEAAPDVPVELIKQATAAYEHQRSGGAS